MNELIKEIATDVGMDVNYLIQTKQWCLIEELIQRVIPASHKQIQSLNAVKRERIALTEDKKSCENCKHLDRSICLGCRDGIHNRWEPAPVQEPVIHQDWCASLTQLLLSNPPQPAPCNCKRPAAQPALKPLTDEQIEAALKTAGIETQLITYSITRKEMWLTQGSTDVNKLVRAIEAAHGITGETK
jgi:hypothetical protein